MQTSNSLMGENRNAQFYAFRDSPLDSVFKEPK